MASALAAVHTYGAIRGKMRQEVLGYKPRVDDTMEWDNEEGNGKTIRTTVVVAMGHVLDCLINANRNLREQLSLNGGYYHFSNNEIQLPKFQSSEIPGISILTYLDRIAEHSKCSGSCFAIALVYIDRLLRTQQVVLTYHNVHRILITRLVHLYRNIIMTYTVFF